MKPIVLKTHSILARIGSSLQSPLLLVIRLYWGWQFFLSGRGKLQNLDRTTGFFQSLHLPFPHVNAVLVGCTECAGGLLLFAGLLSRFVAPILVFEMVVAYATSDSAALRAIFSDPDKFVSADPFLFLFASLIVFVFGPGWLSLDALLFKQKGPGRE